MPKTRRSKFNARRLNIPVTEEVINSAVERDSAHCVLADAIQQALPEVTRVSVDLQTIRFTAPDGTRYVYLTPARQQEVLVNFDQGRKPEPGLLYLARPIQIVPPAAHKGQQHPTVVKVEDQRKVTVHGGRLPPTAALSNTRGRTRRFGIRQLKP